MQAVGQVAHHNKPKKASPHEGEGTSVADTLPTSTSASQHYGQETEITVASADGLANMATSEGRIISYLRKVEAALERNNRILHTTLGDWEERFDSFQQSLGGIERTLAQLQEQVRFCWDPAQCGI